MDKILVGIMGKIFAIGDIHGCFENLSRLMDKISIRPEEDTLIFMGDYIDRGPAAFEVVVAIIPAWRDSGLQGDLQVACSRKVLRIVCWVGQRACCGIRCACYQKSDYSGVDTN